MESLLSTPPRRAGCAASGSPTQMPAPLRINERKLDFKYVVLDDLKSKLSEKFFVNNDFEIAKCLKEHKDKRKPRL